MRFPAPAALALVVLAAAYPGPAAAQTAPGPTPEAAPAAAAPTAPPAPPTAAPLPAPSGSPSPAPTTAPAPAPSASPASPYKYVVTPPPAAPGQPGILEIDLLDQTLHPGGAYSVRVKTTPDVTALSVSAMGQTFGMQSAGPGLFASDGQLPSGIPFFFLNRSYSLVVTAQTADKRSTSFTVSLRLEK